jgi:hypothetical protein
MARGAGGVMMIRNTLMIMCMTVFHIASSTQETDLIPFHLKDREGGCLQLSGTIGACDDASLFLYVENKKDGHSLVSLMSQVDTKPTLNCLSRVSPRSKSSLIAPSNCKNTGSKNWQLIADSNNQYFVTANNKETCLVRTIHSTEAHNAQAKAIKKGQKYFNQKYLHSGLMMQPCKVEYFLNFFLINFFFSLLFCSVLSVLHPVIALLLNLFPKHLHKKNTKIKIKIRATYVC